MTGVKIRAVEVVAHDPSWAEAFEAEAASIFAATGDLTLALHHVGSTAVPGLVAKPIIDLLGIVADLTAADTLAPALAGLGYEAMGAYGIEGRRYFRKADASGRRTHHLHVFAVGSPYIERHLAFRDYLRARPEVAQAYGQLKRTLAATPGQTWVGYCDGKDAFVANSERDALAWAAEQGA